MLFELLTPLDEYISFFRVFRYITVRAALGGVTAFLLSLLIGPILIRKLRDLSIGQTIREEGPQSHHKKAGTPTMGGVLIVCTVLAGTLIWADLSNPFIWVQMFATLGFAFVGFVDDRAKVLKNHNLGLSARGKMLWLIGVAGVTSVWMFLLSRQGVFITEIYFPFFKEFHPDLGIFFILFALLVLLSTTNAVNLTDGLDGLAIGSSGIAFGTFTLIAYVSSHADIAGYFVIPHIISSGELAVFGASMAGACLGFLWYNAHPADIFMGDTGALALGGALGTMALLTGHPLLLVIVGGLFVMEALSVIIQVISFRTRGKRVFRMAPIHHHFELKGWHESQVIIRFWIIALLFSILALSTFKLR
ncbi:MAG: phospho-N-acetylmuramoyl-pentapeptide-transferase [Acidobacteriota bacterium]|nr:phospho-N-acetylmuramoyl-pentapeptide-transferase [Acidobacteriota bacterium]